MSRRTYVDFNRKPPPELTPVEDLVVAFAHWSREWQDPDGVDASGIGKVYEHERGDIEERRQPKIEGMNDDQALEVSRAWAVIRSTHLGHALVLKVQYLRGCGTPQATCRKIGIRPEDWCAMRDTALRMLDAELRRDVLQSWLKVYTSATCKPVAEELLAD